MAREAQQGGLASTRTVAGVLISCLLVALGLVVTFGMLNSALGARVRQSVVLTPTLLSLHERFYVFWPVIYAGLFGYVAWQLLPGGGHSVRARKVARLAALSMVVNAGWVVSVFSGHAWLAVGLSTALMMTLATIVTRLSTKQPVGLLEWLLLDWVFGLYFGWVIVLVCSNISVALWLSGLRIAAPYDQVVANVILAGVVGLALATIRRVSCATPIVAAMAWACAGIGVNRLLGDLPTGSVAAGAFGAAALMVLALVFRNWRRSRRPRGAPATSR